jgi:hypothetical protein
MTQLRHSRRANLSTQRGEAALVRAGAANSSAVAAAAQEKLCARAQIPLRGWELSAPSDVWALKAALAVQRRPMRRGNLTMQYFLRYQKPDQIAPFEERFATERQALVHALAKVTQELIPRVWIEDEGGNVVVSEEDIRQRIKTDVLT